MWLKISIPQKFWFCNSNATNFPTSRECKNFYFSFYTVSAEMLYLQKYLTNFPKLFLAERWGRWLLWLKISSAQIILATFCINSNAVQKFSNIQMKCKISDVFFPFTSCPSRNAISSKVFNEFSKTFFWLKDEEGGYCGWKFQLHRNFGFAIATLQIFQHPENVKFQFFPLHCPSRNAISSKVFNEFSKTFFWLKDEEGGYCGWKFQFHRNFGFAIATLQIFQHPENVKISIFPSHCPSGNAISSKVFNFQKFWPNEKRL